MLELTRAYVAYLLIGYGEPEASAAILESSDHEFRQVQIAANQAAAERRLWLQVACQTAVGLIEGQPRELRREHLETSDMQAHQHLMAADSEKRFEQSRYMMGGAPVKKPQIMREVSEGLAPFLVGYRFFKTRAQFVKPFAGGKAYVGLHRGRGIVYLSFGVTLDEIDVTESRLFGPRPLGLNPQDRPLTLIAVSLNISSNSHTWPHTCEACWLVLYEEGLRIAVAESATLVREVVVPFIDGSQTPASIRDTLLTVRRQTVSLRPAPTLFAIDFIERRRDWLEADFAMLKETRRYRSQESKDQLQREYAITVKCWDDAAGTPAGSQPSDKP